MNVSSSSPDGSTGGEVSDCDWMLVLYGVLHYYQENIRTVLAFGLFFSPRDAMLARYMLSSCVRPSVRHTPVLYQNG